LYSSAIHARSQSSSSQQDPSNGAAVRASRTVLAELQKEKRRRKRNLNDQEKEGKVEYSKLQQNLSNVSGNVQVTKAQIKQKNKEKTSLEGQRRNVNDDIRTNFPRSIDEEKKKTRQHDDEVESCEKKINDFEKEQNLDARRQEKSTLRTDDNVLQKKEKKLRERQGQLLKHQSTVQMLADQNSKLEEVKTTLTEDVEELATAFEEAFDTEIPREEHDASQQNVVARYREKQLITFADKVIEDIDFKEHEIQKKHKNAEKATSKNLTKLNKQDALLTQKQSQLKTVTSKVNALEEGIVAGLTELKEKLDNNDELDYTQSGMEDMLSVLEEKLDKAKEAPMTAKVLLDNWGKIISRFNKKKICTCCNRSADEEEEDAVLEFMVQKKDALEVRVAKYQNTNQDLTDATEQLRQFKQLKGKWWWWWCVVVVCGGVCGGGGGVCGGVWLFWVSRPSL
jgi:DNA repair exonuclease SbcCD ATPase subunit